LEKERCVDHLGGGQMGSFEEQQKQALELRDMTNGTKESPLKKLE
jgi:hypothetical protein